MRPVRSIVLDAAVRGLFPVILVFSVFLLFSGHNQPGGGFIAALVAAAGSWLRFVAGSLPSSDERRWWFRDTTLMGLGLLLATLTAIAGWLGGGELLDMRVYETELPVLGDIKLTSSLPFDIGVYLVVVGVMLSITDTLGRSGPGEAS